jgi:hypothetical protein
MSLHRMRTCWAIAVALLALAGAAHAADDGDEKARRKELSAQRAAAQARYDAAVRDCERSFAVTGCVNQAKAERRATLDRLSREQASLDDVLRKRRAEERRERVAEKQRIAAERAAASAPQVQVRPPRAAASAASAPRPSRRFEPRSPQEAAANEAEAAQRAAASQQRRERARAHQEAVNQRNAERATQRAPAAPLPAPSAPASASKAGSGPR